jgi:cytochrome c oxidase cbb3-type subunit I/II
MGMIFSLMLWMPSWGGMINGLLTLRGVWYKVATDPVLKFFVVGITFYGMSTFEGPMLSIKSVNALSHYTDWTIAHVHSGALGWNGFMTFGMLYWMLPRLFQTKLYSTTLATWHFWLGTLGILLYIVPIYVAGVTQGLMWRAFTPDGNLAYPNFVETVNAIVPMWWARVGGGTLYILGMVLMAYNYFMTWMSRPAVYDVPVIQAAPLTKEFYDDPKAPESRLKGAPVLATANKVDVFEQMVWHRPWERLPVRFTVYVVVAVALASLLELVPTFLIRSSVPLTGKIKPYTPLELLGRDIYVSEGCYNCHSQQIRPLFAETERYGDYSRAEEGLYDRPFQWGSRRIGPDLAREGGRNTHLWHYRHFLAPNSMTQGSIMPAYLHFEKELNFKTLPARIKAVGYLGTSYSDEVKQDPEAHAIAQAKKIVSELVVQAGTDQVSWKMNGGLITINYGGKDIPLERTQMIAVIAYMQRLGYDLTAEETPAAAPTAEPAAAATTEAGPTKETTTEPEPALAPAKPAGSETAEPSNNEQSND